MAKRRTYRNPRNKSETARDCAAPKLYDVTIGSVDSSGDDIPNGRSLTVIAGSVAEVMEKLEIDHQWEHLAGCEVRSLIDVL